MASSLLVGVLRSAGGGPLAVLSIVGAAIGLLALVVARTPAAEAAPAPRSTGLRAVARMPRPLAILGCLTALAFFVENSWQSCSAVQLEVTLYASPAVSSLGPAVFAAAAVVVGRFGGHGLALRVPDRVMIGAGAAIAAMGTLVGALAAAPGSALVGIALAGLGTSVCAPTLFSLAGRNVPGEHGSAVSAVTTLGYLGFLLAPGAVGLVAGAVDLPTALALVAGLAALLAATARFAPVPQSQSARAA